MLRVAFIFDRVAHYQKELFKYLDNNQSSLDIELFLLSGEVPEGASGRIGLKQKIVNNEKKYRFNEWHVGNFIFRKQDGIIKILNEIKPDIVVIPSRIGNISNWQLAFYKNKCGFKLVSWQCGYEYNPSKFKEYLLGKFIRKFDYHLCYHNNAKQYALKYGATVDQIKVIHNTIDEEKIKILPKDDARKQIVKKHPEIGNSEILLYVGAILEEKRLAVVIEALKILNRKDVVFVIVGDGDYLPVLLKKCENRADVVFAGRVVDGVGVYFDAAGAFVLPGTGGLAINEAMIHALPILAGYADGSADDLVVDNKNGFRIRGGTPDELSEKLEIIFSDSEKRDSMGKRSRQRIDEMFRFSNFLDRICDGLRKAAKQ